MTSAKARLIAVLTAIGGVVFFWRRRSSTPTGPEGGETPDGDDQP